MLKVFVEGFYSEPFLNVQCIATTPGVIQVVLDQRVDDRYAELVDDLELILMEELEDCIVYLSDFEDFDDEDEEEDVDSIA